MSGNGINDVRVVLWGSSIGYLHRYENGTIGFQYDPDFLSSGIEVSPLKMPLSAATYSFPGLPEGTFHGLPGLVADSLPDKFGNIIIKRYLESIGRPEDSLSTIEKLCYTGKRGMGALEYEPNDLFPSVDEKADIDALSKLAEEILSQREKLNIDSQNGMIAQLMEAGSSVGGARAKTLIAWNEKTNEVRSGQVNTTDGFDYWLLKFGNVRNNRDRDDSFDDPEYTKIEFAYYLMAKEAGINMSECRLYTENGVSHFMTKRFDRVNGQKLHMQSLGAIAHMDFNSPRTDSYEDAFYVIKKLGLSPETKKEFFRRMVFNEYAMNFDDHVKNIAFLMNKKGEWALAPAYDLTFSYNSSSMWVNAHQMLINGKADDITRDDLLTTAKTVEIRQRDALTIIDQVRDTVRRWTEFAEKSGMTEKNAFGIDKYLNKRIDL